MRLRLRSGQSTVEFALVVVLLLTVLFAIIEFSWVFYNMAYLNNAVNKAAREYIKARHTSHATAKTGAQLLLTDEKGGLTIAWSDATLLDPSFNATTTRQPGNYVKVEATILYPNITPLNTFITYIPSLKTLRSEAILRCE